VQSLGFDQATVIGHDLGGMVAYAYAALYPATVPRLIVMEAAPPGVPPWGQIAAMPGVWHFHFRGPEAEQLVAGRERIYFERFWNSFARDPSCISDRIRDHYAEQYAAPGAMRAGFAQFAAFEQDIRDNAELSRNKLAMPVLAVGGECADRAFSSATAAAMREVASDEREVLIPQAGHWLLEENPEAVVDAVCGFLT
jgi:pimeloyl-ACP methyl ester carboxylesterase